MSICTNSEVCSIDRSINIPTESILETMVKEEANIRSSKWYVDQCNLIAKRPNGWLELNAQIQKDIANRNGFVSDIECDLAINRLRRARYLFPNNIVFQTVPVYVRENKANQGSLNLGDPIPDIVIHDLNGAPIKLIDLASDPIPLIVIGSSHT
jgi:hypothetical protein